MKNHQNLFALLRPRESIQNWGYICLKLHNMISRVHYSNINYYGTCMCKSKIT